MNTTNIIIVILLIVILIPAIRGTLTHMKGEGSCCGGPKEKAPKKKIKGTKIRDLTVHVDGMMCVNCKNRVERVLDDLDGVVAKVNLDRKVAVVSLYQEVDEELIRSTIEEQGYKVTSIE